MKKKLLFLITLIFPLFTFAQLTYDPGPFYYIAYHLLTLIVLIFSVFVIKSIIYLVKNITAKKGTEERKKYKKKLIQSLVRSFLLFALAFIIVLYRSLY